MQKLTNEEIYILYTLLNQNNPSIKISRAWTALDKNIELKIDSFSGLLKEIALRINENDKIKAMLCLENLQKDKIKLLEKLNPTVKNFSEEFKIEMNYKHRKAFGLKRLTKPEGFADDKSKLNLCKHSSISNIKEGSHDLSKSKFTIEEYNKVKNFTYLEYCNYLQNKYGIGLSDYMTKSYKKNKKVTRTKDGLIAHHKMENHAIMLSSEKWAKIFPFEWQKAQNIVYCNLLEHFLLHILICEYPEDITGFMDVGIGGVVNFIGPELNDLYGGWETKQEWRKIVHSVVKDDLELYLILCKRFKYKFPEYLDRLCRSFNEEYDGGVCDTKNQKIYEMIKNI